MTKILRNRRFRRVAYDAKNAECVMFVDDRFISMVELYMSVSRELELTGWGITGGRINVSERVA